MAKRIFSKEHRANLSKACMGRETWSKGKKMPKISLYKNMLAHIRFNISLDWLMQFQDIEQLKTLNKCITNRSGRFNCSDEWYKSYIEKFYYDYQFNNVYTRWYVLGNKQNPYLRPSIDHIVPKAKGGTNDIDNLQFLSWFENRCKNDMTQQEWDNLKSNIGDYLV
jgi:hypothetical protein